MNFIWLIPAFFLTALVYSSAGLAGGSTYLALLALFSFPYEAMPKLALLCNILVSLQAGWFFWRGGHFSAKLFLPFIVSSIPMAVVGGSVTIGKELFTGLLALSLGCAAIRLLLQGKESCCENPLSWRRAWLFGLPVGALLGLVSGLVGIGGGIFLSSLLLFVGWAHPRQAAASSSLFILLNSIAGLFGQFSKGGENWVPSETLPLLVAVFLGGQIGSRLGARCLPSLVLQQVTAIILLVATIRLLGTVV